VLKQRQRIILVVIATCCAQVGCSSFPLASKSTAGSLEKKTITALENENNLPSPSPAVSNQKTAPEILGTQINVDATTESMGQFGKQDVNVAEQEICPALEVASRIFPGGAQAAPQSGVILANLGSNTPTKSSATAQPTLPVVQPITQPAFPKNPDKLPPPAAIPSALDSPVQKASKPNLSKENQQPNHLATNLLATEVTPAGDERFQFTKLVLCKKVEGFGKYDPAGPGYKFSPGSKGFPGERVLVYAEMKNPPCYTAQDIYRTKLSGEVEILRQSDQSVVCKLGFPEREDSSRTDRKDHHLVYSFHVPPSLPPGTYKLRVNARDCSKNGSQLKDGIHSAKSCGQASAWVDFQVDVGRADADSSKDCDNLSKGGGNTP
jgi:hypothetical protein